jgi:hypothetical protein
MQLCQKSLFYDKIKGFINKDKNIISMRPVKPVFAFIVHIECH